MPEGPEVRRFADALNQALGGKPIVSLLARTKAAKTWEKEHPGVLLNNRIEFRSPGAAFGCNIIESGLSGDANLSFPVAGFTIRLGGCLCSNRRYYMDENEQRLLDSWNNNASSWTRVIRHQQIESRVLVTNSAILETVIELKPKTFLDVGCGEGWLCRELFSKGIDGWGVDASAELIEAARQEGDTRFLVSSYSDLTSHKFGNVVHFSCLICNFSILGQRDVAYIASAGHSLLEEQGKIIVQTLHPIIACGDAAYTSEWRETAWHLIGNETFHPAPWYFRTVESWIEEFHTRNYRLLKLREPCHPVTNKPISIIFVFEQQ